VSDDPRRLTTFERRDRLETARRLGGLCGTCGRALAEDEPVYVEQVEIGMRRRVGPYTYPFTVTMLAPLGAECASPDFLKEMEGRQPDPCAGCGRPVYYRTVRPNRHRTLCSRRCIHRANVAKRSATTGKG